MVWSEQDLRVRLHISRGVKLVAFIGLTRQDKLKLLDTWDWRTGDIWMAPPSVLSICSQSNIEVCCRWMPCTPALVLHRVGGVSAKERRLCHQHWSLYFWTVRTLVLKHQS